MAAYSRAELASCLLRCRIVHMQGPLQLVSAGIAPAPDQSFERHKGNSQGARLTPLAISVVCRSDCTKDVTRCLGIPVDHLIHTSIMISRAHPSDASQIANFDAARCFDVVSKPRDPPQEKQIFDRH